MTIIDIYEDCQETSGIPIPRSFHNKTSSGNDTLLTFTRTRKAFANRTNIKTYVSQDEAERLKKARKEISAHQNRTVVRFADETRKADLDFSKLEDPVDTFHDNNSTNVFQFTNNSMEPAPSVLVTMNKSPVSDLRSIRRSLRATVKSPKSITRSVRKNLKDNLIHSQLSESTIPPLTPKSILRQEMEFEADVSLLFSPNMLPVSFGELTNESDENKKSTSCRKTDESVNVKMKNPRSRLQRIAESVKSKNLTFQDKHNDKSAARNMPDQYEQKMEKMTQDNIKSKLTVVVNEDTQTSEIQRSQITKLPVAVSNEMDASKHHPESRCSDSSNMAQLPATPKEDLERRDTPSAESVASTKEPGSHWFSAMPTSILQPDKAVSATSLTPTGNGVCLDLTNFVVDAASTKHKRFPTPNSDASIKQKFSRSPLRQNKLNDGWSHSLTVDICDDWADKQCQSLSQWLNYTFEPTEEKEIDEVDATSDRIALRSLVVHRRTERARSTAMLLYKSSEQTIIRKGICSEILKGRIAIRKDRFLHADLSMRNQILTILFSYSIPWLRLGLETLFSEPIVPATFRNETNGLLKTSMKLAIKTFVVNRVLSDDKILAKYTKGKCLVPSGTFEKKYNAELNAVSLNRILVLIMFLDGAKQANILDKVPNLFVKDSMFKSTRDVLLSLCRDFLQSEGDFVKHLSRIGIQVLYKQDPVDELDFVVHNLAVDLRDGTRLVKLAELITNSEPKSLLTQLRLPVISRLQKLHNVGLALKKLIRFGVPLTSDLAAHHIVDGHRQMVLKLLWTVVAHCCLSQLLDVEKVEMEIQRINPQSVEVDGCVKKEEANLTSADKVERLKDVLLRWCQAICSKTNVKVTNLTKDFASGKVVCNLIHYYHPTLLRQDEIYDSLDVEAQEDLPSYEKEKLYANERLNSILANKRMSQLGGIPQMIPMCDSSNVPEERSMLFCLTFMCSRLMESSIEIRACSVIQKWLRQCYKKMELQKKSTASQFILDTWRKRKSNYFAAREKKYKSAVSVIEDFITKYKKSLIRLQYLRTQREYIHCCVTNIQKLYRGFASRRMFVQIIQNRNASIKIQSIWRLYTARKRYIRMLIENEAVFVIQKFWNCAKVEVKKRNVMAIKIQRIWRGFWSQLNYRINLLDIITVQSCARRWLAKNTSDDRRTATFVIQTLGKKHRTKKRLRQNQAAIQIQTQMRRYAARRKLNDLIIERKTVVAITMIQSQWRKYCALLRLRQIKFVQTQLDSATIIQSAFRSFVSYKKLKTLCSLKKQGNAALTLQCFYRAFVARQTCRYMKNRTASYLAATVIQCLWRKQQCLRVTKRLRKVEEILLLSSWLTVNQTSAALLIQRIWRRKLAFLLLRKRYMSLRKIQSIVRMCIQRRLLSIIRHNIVRLQSKWRSYSARRNYLSILSKVEVCQTIVRVWKAQKVTYQRLHAIITVQCLWRRRCARWVWMDHLQTQQQRICSAVTLQRSWRRLRCWKIYHVEKAQITAIQSFFRRVQAKVAVQFRTRSVVRIQACIRVFLTRCRFAKDLQVRLEYMQRQQLATCQIQATYRGFVERKHLSSLHHSATTIQRIFRGFLCMTDYQLLILDVIVSQTVIRRWLCVRLSQRMITAKVKLQSFARQCLARFQRRRMAAARKIQKTWRCYYIHIDFMILCIQAIHVQAWIRRSLCMKSYTIKKQAILKLQSYTRFILYKLQFSRQTRAATVLQSCTRMIPIRRLFRLYLVEQKSAITLQSNVRRLVTKRKYVQMKHAITMIQSVSRGYLVRRMKQTQSYAATKIQCIWRGYLEYSLYAVKIRSVRWFHSIEMFDKLMEELMVTRMQRQYSACIIQAQFKQYKHRVKIGKATLTIQQAVRWFLSKIAYTKFRQRIVRLQSMIRGRNIRSKRSAKIHALAVRIDRATAQAKFDPSMQLSYRTKSALEVLRKSKSLSEILNAICLLELATRYSESCCQAFGKANAPTILFKLLRSCNRSLPHMEIVRYVLLTLTNVVRYEYLLQQSVVASSSPMVVVEVLLDLIQMFRDPTTKQGDSSSVVLFPLAASLLDRIVSMDEATKNQCASRENQKRLQSIVQLVSRKLSSSGTGRMMNEKSMVANTSCSRRTITHLKESRSSEACVVPTSRARTLTQATTTTTPNSRRNQPEYHPAMMMQPQPNETYAGLRSLQHVLRMTAGTTCSSSSSTTNNSPHYDVTISIQLKR